MRNLFHGRNKVPIIFQAELSECGLACVAMIAGYYGKRTDIRTLRKTSCIPAVGASVKDLLRTAEAIQLQGRPLKLEIEDLTRLALPVVLHWDMDHFVVLTKVSRNVLIIHDPAVGIRKYKRQELGIHFTGIAIEFYPNKSFVLEKSRPSYSLKHLFQKTPSYFRAIVQVFILSLLIQLLALLSPLYLQLVIDQGLIKKDMDLMILLAALFFLVILSKTLASYFRGILLLQFSNQLGFQLVGNVFSHLLSLPVSFFERREIGDIVSRFSSLENIKQLVTQEMITVVVDGIFSLLALIILFLYSPLLALIAVSFVVVFSIVRFIAIPIEKARRQEVLITGAKQQSRFIENIRNVTVTKHYAIEKHRVSDWQDDYADYINTGYQLGTLQLGIASFQGLLFGIDHIATIYLGSSLIHDGQLTLGQLLGFIFLKQHFASSITAMLPKLAEIRLMNLDLERIADITCEKPEQKRLAQSLFRRNIHGNVEVKNLCFSYSNIEHPVIRNISFSLTSGRSLVITGKSGYGKSTLLKLLLGLEKPQSGQILIDDIALCDFDIESYREQVSAVMQNDGLLAGDLAYNINLGVNPHDEERLIKACSLTEIYDYICKLPMGFSTHIGEMGGVLSTGQVQCVLLARALYRSPKILFLDEALSHLGVDKAVAVFQRIMGLGITVIATTHNPHLVELAGTQLEID